MTYPQFNKKHLEEALFGPSDFIRYRSRNTENFPRRVVITYQRSALRYFKKKYSGKYITRKFPGVHTLFEYNGIGFIKMAGIGAPHAVTLFEELIEMGGREFLNIGIAGGLDQQGLFLCTGAIRDEGTSHHYVRNGKYAFPDKELTKRLAKALEDKGLAYQKGTTWTIDAPYRETKAEVVHYKKEGVKTVEMESSALFTVAKVRGVKIASAFAVSDVLGEKWEPRFMKFDVRRGLNLLLDVSMHCLGAGK